MRLRNCVIAFFGVFVGAALTQNTVSWVGVFAAAVSAALITGGGNAINDYFDFEFDKINRPDRPIPSKRISRENALRLSILLFLVGVIISKQINRYCLILAFLNSLTLITYARYSKRMLLLSNLTVSYLVASVFLYGSLAALKPLTLFLNRLPATAWILTLCAFFMTLAREIVKDIEDKEGDLKLGARTLPIVFGERKSERLAESSAASAILLSMAPIVLILEKQIKFNIYAYAPIVLLSDVVFVLAFTKPPKESQRMMVAGMMLSLMAFYLGAVV